MVLRVVEDGLVLDADFAFELTPRLVDVVANGVPLYFRVDFELTRRRWYWFDEARLRSACTCGCPIMRCRGSTGCRPGCCSRAFPRSRRRSTCLNACATGWWWIARVRFADADYDVAVRMRLDTALLPKPFQLSALTGRDLQLESPWKRFIVRLPR